MQEYIIYEDSVHAQVFLVQAEDEEAAWKLYLERERNYVEQPDGTYRSGPFDFAVPIGTSIYGDLAAARSFQSSPARLIDSLGADVMYVSNHFRNNTVGDYKDKNFPGIGRLTKGTRLYDLADNGGNMNGAMGMEGLDMNSWETGMSGVGHRALMSHGTVWSDDAMGAAVLQVGWHYATQIP